MAFAVIYAVACGLSEHSISEHTPDKSSATFYFKHFKDKRLRQAAFTSMYKIATYWARITPI